MHRHSFYFALYIFRQWSLPLSRDAQSLQLLGLPLSLSIIMIMLPSQCSSSHCYSGMALPIKSIGIIPTAEHWHPYCLHSSLALTLIFIIIIIIIHPVRQWSLPLSRDAHSLQQCFGRARASLLYAFVIGILIHKYYYYYLSFCQAVVSALV